MIWSFNGGCESSLEFYDGLGRKGHSALKDIPMGKEVEKNVTESKSCFLKVHFKSYISEGAMIKGRSTFGTLKVS